MKNVWKKLGLMMIAALCLVPILALADGVAVAVASATEVPTEDFLKLIFESMGKVKGASAMAIVALVVQLVMVFFKTPLAGFAGKYKLLIVSGVTVVGSVLALMATGMPFVAALINGGTLAAIQVFAHQIFVQFITKKDEQPTTTTK